MNRTTGLSFEQNRSFTDDGISVTLTDFVLLSLEVFARLIDLTCQNATVFAGFIELLSLRDLADGGPRVPNVKEASTICYYMNKTLRYIKFPYAM
jgi:hypothetical protein